MQKPPGIAEAIDWLAALDAARARAARRGGGPADARVGAEVPRGSGRGSRRRTGRARRGTVGVSGTSAPEFGVETVLLDLPPLVGAFSRRLHDAGLPVTAERSALLAQRTGADRAGRPAASVLHRTRRAAHRPVSASGVRHGCSRRCSASARRGWTPASCRRSSRRRGGVRRTLGRRRARAVAPPRESGDGTPALGAPPRSPDRARPARGRAAGADRRDRRGGAARQALRRARARRAGAALRADDAADRRDAPAAVAPASACPPRRAGRRARDDARQPADRWRSDPAWRAAGVGASAGGWCCCATSRARWSPTRGPTCSS